MIRFMFSKYEHSGNGVKGGLKQRVEVQLLGVMRGQGSQRISPALGPL